MILKTFEEQRLFLKAVGTVLANEDIGLIIDSVFVGYGSDDSEIFDFKFGFSSYYKAHLGKKIIDECEKLGIVKTKESE